MSPTRVDSRAKLLGKIRKDETGCWIWTAYVDKQTGYGRVSWGTPRRAVWAHRASYEEFVGPMKPKMVIDHLCGNRLCINPGHLELVTRGENNRRGGVNGTAWCGRYGHKSSHCSERCGEAGNV